MLRPTWHFVRPADIRWLAQRADQIVSDGKVVVLSINAARDPALAQLIGRLIKADFYRAAQSRRDFIHKMQVCLKELRETQVWLELLQRTDAGPDADLGRECDELTAIFVASINTARRKRTTRNR